MARLPEFVCCARRGRGGLHARYGRHPSFVGLYDPNEPNSRDWSGEEAPWLADLVYRPVWGWARFS
eukprot:3131693-Prymnesium_polylepis.1